ncbi:hypothetical protein [Emticicia sp.]|uniref:hypothetical protein n=1 Tax=Emticicia sp. TaxID=1930953 RepID=UPI003753563C
MGKTTPKELTTFDKVVRTIFVIVIAIPIFYLMFWDDKKSENSSSFVEPQNELTQSKRFILTHLLGERMKNDAYFTLTGDTEWTLDYRNGDKIKYKIISYNKYNQLCGMDCVDSLGERCEICISKQSGNETIITIDYKKGVLTYKGYYE